MKKIKAFFPKHWIGAWVGASVLYAFVIHCLYYRGTNIDFFVSAWGAGDILTYASTVSLGLLALWQNKKIQEENDIAQKNLMDTIKRNNELEVISKIIEHEERSINAFKELANEFRKDCSVQSFGLTLTENWVDYLQNVTELEQKIDKTYNALHAIVNADSGISGRLNLLEAVDSVYGYAKESINRIRTQRLDFVRDVGSTSLFQTEMWKLGRAFEDEKENYLLQRQNRLHYMLLQNVSLDDIKKMFNA